MASARLKNIGISAYKLRLIIDKVRGKKVIYAENQLRYLKSPASKVILKLLQSVTSNAENNDLQNKQRIICDYISGMTDRYASNLYKSLYD